MRPTKSNVRRSVAVVTMRPCRLIVDAPQPGPWNMAVDEVLLTRANDTGRSTLRIYRWSEPTLSLGYFQKIAHRQSHTPSQTCPLIRRTTGGGAILHHHDLTYSLALPIRQRWSSPAADLYQRIHQSIILVLHQLGWPLLTQYQPNNSCEPKAIAKQDNDSGESPFLCFQRRTCGDITWQSSNSPTNTKIGGSAQRRSQGAVLQHGSLLLSRSEFAPELEGLRQLVSHPADTSPIGQSVGPNRQEWNPHSDTPPNFTSLETWLGTLTNRLVQELAQQIAQSLGFDLEPSDLTDREKSEVSRLATAKFALPAWNGKR